MTTTSRMRRENQDGPRAQAKELSMIFHLNRITLKKNVSQEQRRAGLEIFASRGRLTPP